jgi:predicted ATP-grasp superfamily ATP-dependent carboligase
MAAAGLPPYHLVGNRPAIPRGAGVAQSGQTVAKRVMQIFLYEYTTGGGLLAGELESGHADSLVAEGAAMLQALADDFAALAGIEVVALRDARRAPDLNIAGQLCDVSDTAIERRLFERLVRASAWTVIVAPELRGVLATRCEMVRRAGGRILNCSPEGIALAADKHKLAEHLARHSVPVPVGERIAAGQQWPVEVKLPAVVKPCDGAGSCGVRLIATESELAQLPRPACDYRLERYSPGLPVSVGLLCGPAGNSCLPACRQHLGGVTGFEYQGGSLPLDPHLDERARSLAQRAADCLPGLLGFVGVDLVLGAAADGNQDYVIEVNSRLTTSYVGLRVAAEQNLAVALMAVAEGRKAQLSFSAHSLQFSSNGRIDASDVTQSACRVYSEAHPI